MTHKNHTVLSTGCVQLAQRLMRAVNILIILSFFAACSSPSRPAPVTSRTAPPSTKVLTHVVAPGETLYSIAWRYGFDYKALARANNIGYSYTIFPGQIIQLRESFEVDSRSVARTTPLPAPVPAPATSRTNTQQSEQKANNPSVLPQPTPVPSVRSENKPSAPKPVVVTPVPASKIIWRWPASGRVITNFSNADAYKKGIDIAGKKGDSVFAAAAGEVVYAGSGLRGYGKLVIIKHNDTYLSAYAHNQRLRVQEGDLVRSGQHIADLGSTGTGTRGEPKLHFQIRRDGQSIDPLRLLPKRNS